jgi:hypothetical protein
MANRSPRQGTLHSRADARALDPSDVVVRLLSSTIETDASDCEVDSFYLDFGGLMGVS